MADKKKKVVKEKVTKEKSKKEELRKVPFKNYLILLLVCIITISLFAGGSVVYRKIDKRKYEVSRLEGIVPEISPENLDNYTVENDFFYLYIGSTDDYSSHAVENEIIDYLKKKDIKKDLVRLNVKKINNYNEFVKTFNAKYSKYDYTKLETYPAFIIMKDGKVLNLVQKTSEARLAIGNIDTLLDEYGY